MLISFVVQTNIRKALHHVKWSNACTGGVRPVLFTFCKPKSALSFLWLILSISRFATPKQMISARPTLPQAASNTTTFEWSRSPLLPSLSSTPCLRRRTEPIFMKEEALLPLNRPMCGYRSRLMSTGRRVEPFIYYLKVYAAYLHLLRTNVSIWGFCANELLVLLSDQSEIGVKGILLRALGIWITALPILKWHLVSFWS